MSNVETAVHKAAAARDALVRNSYFLEARERLTTGFDLVTFL